MIAPLRHVLALLAGCLFLVQPVGALEIALVLSQKGGAHALFAEALAASLAPGGHRLVDGGAAESGLDSEAIARADLVVTGGVAATEAVLRRTDRPTLAVLLSQGQYQVLRRQYPDAALSAIVLDQPPARQLALIAALLPDSRRVGVLFGPDTIGQETAFQIAAAEAGVQMVRESVSSAAQLMPVLERTLGSTDVLLALADPLLIGAGAARSLLLSSYRYGRPVVAYSRAYVDAGALAAVFSGPGDAARDVAEWLDELDGRTPSAPTMRAPRHFEVAINQQVARALDLRIVDVPTIRERMRMEDRP